VRGLELLPRNGDWAQARVGVLGLGRSGRGALRLLARHDADATAFDDRVDAATLDALLADGLGHVQPLHAREDVSGRIHDLDVLVVSPGVPGNHPLIAAAEISGVVVISELELAWRRTRGAVVAVTGTNGKSTTVTLVHALLAAAGHQCVVAGNIGIALSDQVEQVDEGGVLVVECSSFQLERIMDFHPRVAAVLNVAPDHLDRYASFDDYVQAKHNLLRNQEPGDVFVYPADDERLGEWARNGVGRGASFSMSPAGRPESWVQDGMLMRRRDGGAEALLEAAELSLLGAPHLLNMTAALACVAPWSIDRDLLVPVLREFQALPHRAVRVEGDERRTWIDDSKATNVHAASATLSGLEGPVLLLAGGSGKDEDYGPLASFADRVRCVLCFGAEGPAIRDALQGQMQCELHARMIDALVRADELGREGDTILLSPACASFDEFSGFAERGEVFANWVLENVGGKA